jgi:hypothetical protein
MTHQRFTHTLPIGIKLPLVYNFTANGDDIDRLVGIVFSNRRGTTVHDHAEIVVVIRSVFAGLDIGVALEPFDRLLKGRELGYHNSLYTLRLIRVEHLAWAIPCKHIDIVLGVGRRRVPPVALEPRPVPHRLADINKIARHTMHLLDSHWHSGPLRDRGPNYRMNTVFPLVWPAIIKPIASRASVI